MFGLKIELIQNLESWIKIAEVLLSLKNKLYYDALEWPQNVHLVPETIIFDDGQKILIRLVYGGRLLAVETCIYSTRYQEAQLVIDDH